MTEDELQALFDKHDAEYLKFDQITTPLHRRSDICAFMKLHNLVPGRSHMIEGADHDVIYLDTSLEDLAEVATEDDVIYLIRCGVRSTGEHLEMIC